MTLNRTLWTARLERLSAFARRPPDWFYEWLLIAVWGLWLSRVYLGTGQYIWPAGYGLGNKLFGNQIWVNLLQCGLCAFWNGSLNGGHPALADLFGSQMHPLMAVTTLLFGVMGGFKISIIAIPLLGGVAQWCIARALQLGRVARVWSALAATAGGHLAMQQWEGNFGLSLALVSAAFVIAAVLAFGRAPTRRNAVLLGLAGAVLIVSGQGYVQAAVVGWAPALLFFRLNQTRAQAGRYFRELLMALGLAVLLAAVLVVPSMHFSGNFTKELYENTWSIAQPFEYVPINYVANDPAYFVTPILGKVATADLPYIGWVPLLLAVVGLRFFRGRDLPALGFLWATALLSMLFTAAIPFRWLSTAFPYLLWLRNFHVLVDAAVPSLLGLAAFGLDRLWRRAWPRMQVAVNSSWTTALTLNTQWLLLLPLFGALASSSDFVARYVVPQDMTTMYTQYIEHFETDSAQWISPPGDVVWTQPAIDQGYKITYRDFSGSRWGVRAYPAPYLISVNGEFTSDKPYEQVDAIEALPVYRIPSNEYAYVTYADGTIVGCPAESTGGFITVRCATDRDGLLTVTENIWNGWFAWKDGVPVTVFMHANDEAQPWLLAEATNGSHIYEFKYLPWDGFLGVALTLLGLYLAVRWWRAAPPEPQRRVA